MKRFISNYTILGDGEELVNHITTVDDNGRLISVLPFDRELGNTVYVPQPLCVAANSELHLVEEAFAESASRKQLKQRLVKLKVSQPHAGTPVMVLRLDFAHNIINQL
ncbi:MAG: hypothetical protein J6X22_09715 [Muribaculaceae bacterium]|nr:hypothetical protein [Muribaculaceae bacterium]